jgi:hypothetical protein
VRLGRHVERCEGCRREQAAYAALDRALAALPMTAPVPPRLERDALRSVRVAADEDTREGRGWSWRWALVAVPAGAAAALALVLTSLPSPSGSGPAPARQAGVAPPQVAQRVQPRPRSTPAAPGPRRRRGEPAAPEPPPELAARPDLFVNLPLLRNMEKLQHYDAIQTTTLDGRQEDRSSG